MFLAEALAVAAGGHVRLGLLLVPALFVQYLYNTVAAPSDRWTVGVQSIVEQHTANDTGGPQALEGWTKVQHDRGVVRLALGAIGNVEVTGQGEVDMARSLQGGGRVAPSSHVRHWSSLTLSVPTTGQVDRVDYITFDNGWSLRPQGAALVVCSPQQVCRPL